MSLFKKIKQKVSSRRQIAIKEVKDDILVLPDNEYRVAIETSSVNFELKSEEEQDILIDSFQNFLNSLPSRIQILIRTREVDIDQYIDHISQTKNAEKMAVYKEQIGNYCDFMKELVSGNKLLSRRFFIVIPYRPDKGQTDFNLVKEQLYLTRDLIAKSLEKLGMRAKPLDSLEILDLFYSFYNPDQAKTQELKYKAINAMKENGYV